MQIIQSIREKGAAIIIVVIALSLIGFILMDAKQGNNSLFGSVSTEVGYVNGDAIELSEFNKRVKQAEDMQAQRTGQQPTAMQTYQLREQMWNQLVAERLFFGEAQKLGIQFTPKELSYVLLSNDPSNPLTQEPSLKDSLTGKLDVKKAQTALTNIKKMKGEQREGLNAQLIDPLKLNKTVSKYAALLNASAYYPTWMEKKDNQDNIQFSTIQYVNVSYGEIADSTIKISDEEVVDYVNKHKKQFKQEKGRNISYVTFSQLPSKEDSLMVYNALMDIRQNFETDTNTKAFVARNTSVIEFNDDFSSKSSMDQIYADTLAKLPNGSVFGPYIQGKNYVLAKMLGARQQPDSASARHILIASVDPNTQQPIRSDSAAKKLADSILAAIQSGADFGAMAKQYSADASNKDKAGDLGTFSYGTMVPEFNTFCFTKTPGTKAVVKTDFGYHIIDLIGQKNFNTAYKIAYVAKEISASDVTINKSSLDATKTSSFKTKEELEKYAAKNGLSFTAAPSMIKENDFMVGMLQDARALVRWAFEAKAGQISEPFSIGDQFVVAVLDKVMEEGLQDAKTARPGCEAIIRNKKKAEIIRKKIGNNPTLQSVASAYNKSVQTAGADSMILFTSQIINGVGMENKVIGASFNKAYQSKPSPLIDGTTGVFIIQITGFGNKPAATPDVLAQQAQSKLAALRSQTGGWYEGLKKAADIKDNRSTHF
jgi:peptidyl-prolyl cis-trans isomerase D